MYDASGLRSNDSLERYCSRHNGRLPTKPIPSTENEEKPVEDVIADHNESMKKAKK